MTKARELFADEQAYLTHQRNLAEIAKRGQRAAIDPKQFRNYALPRKWARREKWRRDSANWRARNPERRRELSSQSYWRHRDKRLARKRAWHFENREMRNLIRRDRYSRHRDAELAYRRQYNDTHRMERHAYARAKWRQLIADADGHEKEKARLRALHTVRLQADPKHREYRAAVETLEEKVYEARSIGFSWRQIGELVGRNWTTCRKAYDRAVMRREGRVRVKVYRSPEQQRAETREVLRLRGQGLNYKEISERVGKTPEAVRATCFRYAKLEQREDGAA